MSMSDEKGVFNYGFDDAVRPFFNSKLTTNQSTFDSGEIIT